MFRKTYRSFCLRRLEQRCNRMEPLPMDASAVVFSPHFDDETLGAGGTILLKRRRGARVHLVFMTDGSRSHAHAMAGGELAAIRRAEALRAAQALGVDANHVTFLDYPETELEQHREAAVVRVAGLLEEMRCEQVFVPSTREPLLWSADHRATTETVFRALQRGAARPEIVEYPIWFWHHWPWVPMLGSTDARQLFKRSLAGCFGLAAWRCFNTAVPIAGVHADKRKALEAHASQMVRQGQNVPWPVLGDVSGGEFLEQFFGANEFFARYRFEGGMNFTTR